MSKLELFFTGLFIIGTIVIMILIYFYNTRHNIISDGDENDYEVETKPGEKAIVDADENFNWDLYESDLRHDYDAYVGYDIWKTKKSAEERISFLCNEFESGSNVLKINMFESMMLIDEFADNITLSSDGIYRINDMLMAEFLKNLVYDQAMVEKIEELKDELDFSIDTYEIDARKIFYIMRNASKLGVSNFNSHSQVFLFAKNNKKITFEAEIVDDKNKNIGELDLYIEKFESTAEIFNEELSGSQEDENISRKNKILSGIRNITKNAKIYFDESGQRIIEYPNGQKLIKKNLWTVDIVDEEDQKVYNSNNVQKKEKFSDIIKESNVDEIMLNETQKESAENISNNVMIKKNKDEKIKILNEKILNAKFYKEDKSKESIVGFFGEIENIDEYFEKLNLLDQTNRKVLVILLLSIDAGKVIVDDEEISLIVENDGIYYLSYEWVQFIFISLVENRNEFLLKNRIVNKSNYVSNFSAGFVDRIIKYFKDSEMFIFKENVSQKYTYYKTSNDLYVSTSLLELSKDAEHLLTMYNSSDRLYSVKVNSIEKNKFKDYDGKKYNLSFKTMFE